MIPSATSGAAPPCHVCGAGVIDVVDGYDAFWRVTSDCRPWRRGGTLGVCRSCGCVQKVPDAAWRSETEQIYGAYDIYHQGGGTEQAVFDPVTGRPATRSERLLQQLQLHVSLPWSGRLLDVGCGNGALLGAFAHARPAWTLAGTELHDRHRAMVERIPAVEALYTCSLEDIPGRFDLITLVHVLEHIPEPSRLLAALKSRLASDGLLVIEAPAYHDDPFDLLIADHCTHFSGDTIRRATEAAGYEVIALGIDWIPKELTVVAGKATRPEGRRHAVGSSQSLARVTRRTQWLRSVAVMARAASARRPVGIFGTAIAATWLFAELDGRVEFFVDEDPHRVGRRHLDRPIYHPHDAPAGSDVFIALPPRFAALVQERLARQRVAFRCHVPTPASWSWEAAGRPHGETGDTA